MPAAEKTTSFVARNVSARCTQASLWACGYHSSGLIRHDHRPIHIPQTTENKRAQAAEGTPTTRRRSRDAGNVRLFRTTPRTPFCRSPLYLAAFSCSPPPSLSHHARPCRVLSQFWDVCRLVLHPPARKRRAATFSGPIPGARARRPAADAPCRRLALLVRRPLLPRTAHRRVEEVRQTAKKRVSPRTTAVSAVAAAVAGRFRTLLVGRPRGRGRPDAEPRAAPPPPLSSCRPSGSCPRCTSRRPGSSPCR